MTKVDILNQHLYNELSIKLCHRACRIRRDPVPSEVESESLWYKFCDDVDQALQLVNEAKQISRKSLLPSFILILAFLLLTVGPAFVDYDFKYRGYVSYAVIGVLILFQIYTYCRVRTSSKTAFHQVSHICEEYSDNQIKFFVLAEKKRHFRLKRSFVHKHYVLKVCKQNGGGGPLDKFTAVEDGEPLFPIVKGVTDIK